MIVTYLRALDAWEKIDTDSEFKGSSTKIYQRLTELLNQFIGKLYKAVQREVKEGKGSPIPFY